MSGLKAIRRRITSVRNTKQITRAMKLVSAAKLRRAQDSALSGRKYRDELESTIRKVLAELPLDFSHPLLEHRRSSDKRRVLVVAGERGLCGAYNANVVKLLLAHEAQGLTSGRVTIYPIGKQAITACKRFEWPTGSFSQSLGEDASMWPAQRIAEKLLKDYETGEFDELVIYYTQFVSAMNQTPTRVVLLPFQPPSTVESTTDSPSNAVQLTRFDPRPEAILFKLLPILLGTQLRQAGLEAKASEHSARMTAMDAATRNADELIGKLRLYYNRARQSAITRELIDIVGGAEAIS